MIALVNVGSNAELREVPIPKPKKGWALIKVAYAGWCSSDSHILAHDIQLKTKPPCILGHEGSGTVLEVNGAHQELVGKNVVWETAVKTCGNCWSCMDGHENQCANKIITGYSTDGTFAPYLVMPTKNLHVLPDSVSLKAGALVEPLACAVHAFYERIPIPPDFFTAVIGPGTIGNLVTQCAKASGNEVILFGKPSTEHRIKIAKEVGILGTIKTDDEMDEHYTEKFEFVFECSGSTEGVNRALRMAKRGGYVIQVGLGGASVIDWAQIAYKELFVTGSIGSEPSSWLYGLKLLWGGKIKTEPLVTDIYHLTDWQVAFENFSVGRGLKHVFKFGEE